MSAGDTTHDRLVITAASESYAPSLLALLGSLNLNWPSHPPVLVYDIGLEPPTLGRLRQHGVPVKRVPAFCPHWRDHYTWKLWCLDDAPARDVFWMDSGLVVLRPLDEVFDALARQGYFLTRNGQRLDWEASEQACLGCGLEVEFRLGKPTLAATLMGFRKSGPTLAILEQALAVGMVERNIAATTVAHRHDQAIISLLVYKHLGRVAVANRAIYLGSRSPHQVPGQKVWVHRRSIREADAAHLAAHISTPGEPFTPEPPERGALANGLRALRRVYWLFGRGDQAGARRALALAFRIEPGLRHEPPLVARRLRAYHARLAQFPSAYAQTGDFRAWALEQLGVIAGERYVEDLARHLARPKRSRPERRLGPTPRGPRSLLGQVVRRGQMLARQIVGRAVGR